VTRAIARKAMDESALGQLLHAQDAHAALPGGEELVLVDRAAPRLDTSVASPREGDCPEEGTRYVVRNRPDRQRRAV